MAPAGISLQLVDEDRAFGAQIVDDIGVVHDLMAHVDRRAVHCERALDDLDRPIDAGTETARLREHDFHRFRWVRFSNIALRSFTFIGNKFSRGRLVAIKDWPEGERPRERLLASGAQALSDAELLAVFLRTGTRGTISDRPRTRRAGALRRAQWICLRRSLTALAEVGGFGPAKYTQLQAVLELARRALQEDVKRDTLLSSPGKVRDYLRLILARLEHEVFMALYLDAQNRLLATEELFRGTLTQTSVYPREVVKRALKHNAAAVIFAHNHPSGVAEPSRADELLTAT